MKKVKKKHYKHKRKSRVKVIAYLKIIKFMRELNKVPNKNLSSPIQECSEETIEELNNTFKDMAINSKEFWQHYS